MGRIAHFHAPWCEFQLSWMSVLNENVDFITLLIFAEGARLLQEDGTGETPQAL
jgi:hypothetical protein